MNGLTLEAKTLEVCTHMLYNADPTVRVRTEPALRLVIATDSAQLNSFFHMEKIWISSPIMA